MDYEEMRLECLKLADGDVEKAAKLFDFCRGRGDFSPLAPSQTEPAKFDIVGKDGDLGKFKDYVKE